MPYLRSHDQGVAAAPLPAQQPTMSPSAARATAQTRARYDRLAPLFDRMEARAEAARFRHWRTALWDGVIGPRVLELGVGTGKNIPYYRARWDVTGVDLSPRMLARAQERAEREGRPVELLLGDAQALPFPDSSFDSVVATFVFCSVPDPVQGLREAYRVLKPGGQLQLLEHVLSANPILRPVMRGVNPVVVRMMGANIDRDTTENVAGAGFHVEHVVFLWRDIVTLIAAERSDSAPG